MAASARKPHNDTAGYVAERKLPSGRGHLVLLDRTQGGDWVDADGRWVMVLMRGEAALGTLGVSSRAMAYDIMKAEASSVETGIDWGERADWADWEAA